MVFWQITAFDENHGFRDFRVSVISYCPYSVITGQAKVKQTSGPQTVKTHIKSFFAFSHFICFRTSISQIQFRILYVVRFRTSHFIRARLDTPDADAPDAF